jgi:WhiB family redox-sensing transcriptional regulator
LHVVNELDDPLTAFLATVRPAWMRDGLCLEHPEITWFPTDFSDVEPAKAVCARCAVRDECLDYALAERLDFGIWGGVGGRERRRMRLGRVA